MRREMVFGIVLILVLGYLMAGLQTRYRHPDADVYAYYLEMPGVAKSCQTKDVVSLRELEEAGLQFRVSGATTEKEILLSLSKLDYFRNHEVVSEDGEWVLFRPERCTSHFTMRAQYRVSPFFEVG